MSTRLRETLAAASGARAEVERVFAQQVYQVAKVDDRIDRFSSVEELPQPGTSEVGGKWVEQGEAAVEKRIEQQRERWHKANPKPKAGSGPFPFRTSVTVRRRGAGDGRRRAAVPAGPASSCATSTPGRR